MQTDPISPISTGDPPKLPSMPTEGLELIQIKVEAPSLKRFQSVTRDQDQAPKPLTHYQLQILSQTGHDQLVAFLEQKSPDQEIPFVTTLDISENLDPINLDALFKAFPGINSLFLNSNRNISMTQLISYPSLRDLTFDQVKIYWDEEEKERFINEGLGKNLSIYLTCIPYFFDHLSARACQLLAYLFNALIFVNILEFLYTNYHRDSHHQISISNRLLVNFTGFLILRLSLALYWRLKAANESFEITRKKKAE